MNTDASPSPFSGLSVVIRAVIGVVACWAGRRLLSGSLALLVHGRLGGIAGRMERLAARFQAGLLRARETPPAVGQALPEVVETAPVAAAHSVRPRGKREWPGGFGWLVRLMAWQAAGYGSQLRTILGEPEMVALLVAAPQAARILRPLCRMLGVETALLRPGMPAARRMIAGASVAAGEEGDAADAAPRKRVRKPRAKMDWGRIPLPRGVLSAARRQGFYKGR